MQLRMVVTLMLAVAATSSLAEESKESAVARAKKAVAAASKCQAVAEAVEGARDAAISKSGGERTTWFAAAAKASQAASNAAEQAEAESDPAAASAAADRAEALAKKAEDLAKTATEPKALDYGQLAKNASDSFAGINFSLGMGASVGGVEEVFEADVVGEVAADPEKGIQASPGVVRVTKRGKSRPRLLLEAHKFPWTKEKKIGGSDVRAAQYGFGPFVAIQSSESELLEAFGLGVMGGIRLGDTDKTSINFGVGMLLDPNVRTLGEDILEGEPLPQGETAIRYHQEAKWRLLILASFTF